MARFFELGPVDMDQLTSEPTQFPFEVNQVSLKANQFNYLIS